MVYKDTQGITWMLEEGDCTHLIGEGVEVNMEEGFHEVAFGSWDPTSCVYYVKDGVVTHSRYDG